MAVSRNDQRLIELKDVILQLNNTIKELNDTIKRERDENNNLRVEIEYLKGKLFGSSREKTSDIYPGQMSLFNLEGFYIEEEKPVELIEPEIVAVAKKPRKKKAAYDEQFKNLPIRQVVVDTLSDEDKKCLVCGEDMVMIGTEVIRTTLEYTPAKLERVQYLAPAYACPNCKDTEEPQFVKDNGTPAFLEHSYISETLLASIAYNKYALYLPLYRQEKDFKELNAPISRTAMATGLIKASELYLTPLYDFFHRKLLKRQFIMMDETPMQVLKEDGKRAQTKSYYWVVRSGEDGLPPIVLFNYTPTRAGANAKEFLKGIEPNFYLMADGYQGYNVVGDVRRCVCYAHIRRYFYEAIPKGSKSDYTHPAVQGVLYCDKLFAYERTYKEKCLSHKQIKNRRQKDQKPIVEAFLAWVKQVDPGSSAKLKKAITYVKNREPYLMTYLEDGRCSLSNNLSENAIRPATVGRKNWLFSDTPAGATANSVYLSIIEMAKAYGLNLYDYLTFVFKNRPNEHWSDEDFEKIAPWNEKVQEQFRAE